MATLIIPPKTNVINSDNLILRPRKYEQEDEEKDPFKGWLTSKRVGDPKKMYNRKRKGALSFSKGG